MPYDPSWPAAFQLLRRRIWPAVQRTALSVEHVGSTAVKGLPAKPIIDLTVVVPFRSDVPDIIDRLSVVGYRHLGDQGIEGREAFDSLHDGPRHHLYLSPQGSLALHNHLIIRTALRRNPALARRYAELKLHLAQRFSHDLDAYTAGKTEFLLEVLSLAGLDTHRPRDIRSANALPSHSER
ncbi:GrpB family protein [Deinococcus sonorensis]|uniref:GrpB family protein n=1 Tax=Deinococcus sonorensis TaxID=309891 RepID=A0ABV8Y799_9DEIO